MSGCGTTSAGAFSTADNTDAKLKCSKFFAANPGLKQGDSISITELEKGKRYALKPMLENRR